ncbi:MAG: hypothetical protein HQK56_21030 [Deltaproteobacteria bacterium]|nr:hypothetical protein [Deltaproteobacteria bacterium]
MFGISGQLSFAVDIAGAALKDYLGHNDFGKCVIIEQAGNMLPRFELVFRTKYQELISLINEGNPITIAFRDGSGSSDTFGTQMRIITKTIQKNVDFYNIRIVGLLNALPYIGNCQPRILDKHRLTCALPIFVYIGFEVDNYQYKEGKECNVSMKIGRAHVSC